MLLHETSNDIELMEASRKALDVIEADRESKSKSLWEEVQKTLTSSTFAQSLYEEYDEVVYEQKAKVDLMYYEQLLQKMDTKYTEDIHETLTSLTKIVGSIYEFINIEPEVFGRDVAVDILEDSDEQVKQKLSKVIYETLDRDFYALSLEERKQRYLERSREMSRELINEGATPGEAIQFSVKTSVMENLLRKIAFPFSVYSRITTLMESEDYAEIFDQDKLIELVSVFETKIFNISKIVCTVI